LLLVPSSSCFLLLKSLTYGPLLCSHLLIFFLREAAGPIGQKTKEMTTPDAENCRLGFESSSSSILDCVSTGGRSTLKLPGPHSFDKIHWRTHCRENLYRQTARRFDKICSYKSLSQLSMCVHILTTFDNRISCSRSCRRAPHASKDTTTTLLHRRDFLERKFLAVHRIFPRTSCFGEVASIFLLYRRDSLKGLPGSAPD
jgi:hypothetical protein